MLWPLDFYIAFSSLLLVSIQLATLNLITIFISLPSKSISSRIRICFGILSATFSGLPQVRLCQLFIFFFSFLFLWLFLVRIFEILSWIIGSRGRLLWIFMSSLPLKSSNAPPSFRSLVDWLNAFICRCHFWNQYLVSSRIEKRRVSPKRPKIAVVISLLPTSGQRCRWSPWLTRECTWISPL